MRTFGLRDAASLVILCVVARALPAAAAPQLPNVSTVQRQSIQQSIDRAINDTIQQAEMKPADPYGNSSQYVNFRIVNGILRYDNDEGLEVVPAKGEAESLPPTKAQPVPGSQLIGGDDGLNIGEPRLPNAIELPHLTLPAYADTAVSTDGFTSLQFLQIYGNSKLSSYHAPSSVGSSLSSAGHSLSSAGNSLSSVGHSLSSAGNSLSSVGHSLSSAGTGPSSAGLQGYDPSTGQYFPTPATRLPNPSTALSSAGGAFLCGR